MRPIFRDQEREARLLIRACLNLKASRQYASVGTEIARLGERVVDEVERFVGGLPLRWQEH